MRPWRKCRRDLGSGSVMWVQRMYCQCIANVLQDNGKLLIGTGELFCRVNNGDEDEEVELCGKVCECIILTESFQDPEAIVLLKSIENVLVMYWKISKVFTVSSLNGFGMY